MAEISGTLCEENEIASDNYYQDYKTPQMTNTFSNVWWTVRILNKSPLYLPPEQTKSYGIVRGKHR